MTWKEPLEEVFHLRCQEIWSVKLFCRKDNHYAELSPFQVLLITPRAVQVSLTAASIVPDVDWTAVPTKDLKFKFFGDISAEFNWKVVF